MQIISHRGYWLQKPERNLPEAFHRSFDLGFGTETDVRDVAGQLVISHDMPAGGELTLNGLLDIMAGRNLPLAINVKADGLAQALAATFARYGHTNWFTFDMAVPDMRSYLNANLTTYTRLSDVEPSPAWLEQAAGVWLDGFEGEWFSNQVIGDLLSLGKRICVVSPELHGRGHDALWQQLLEFRSQDRLTLCTDFPADAATFFT
ncbi:MULTISPECIES: phosphodiesterase [Pseudomonas]|uniref:phosphodiesterase n=1 Tax=Pseudomonas TaxID=286 RepID=UPI000DACBB60|nr:MULTISPECIES: phosphodiesterase [Pseudomonas]MCA5972265.1 phosphodiesterase [Pseudomonas sp. P135]MCH5533321.1 phosphodiesterase [Pseudomonas syringae pv. syringae]MCH5570515.1 phosphodiesterase [Pseudomonas syringae pv. syringae]